jgi:hypothetical protein
MFTFITSSNRLVECRTCSALARRPAVRIVCQPNLAPSGCRLIRSRARRRALTRRFAGVAHSQKLPGAQLPVSAYATVTSSAAACGNVTNNWINNFFKFSLADVPELQHATSVSGIPRSNSLLGLREDGASYGGPARAVYL